MHIERVPGDSAIRIALRGGAHPLTRVLAGLWAAGWVVIEAGLVAQPLRTAWTIGDLFWVGLWTGVGVLALVAIVWAVAGKPEVLIVSGRALRLRRGIGPFGRVHDFDGSAVRALRVFGAAPALAADYATIRAFWDRGAGRVAFDVANRTYMFGPALDDAAVRDVCSAIIEQLPGSPVQPADLEPDTLWSPRRAPGWPAYVTTWVIAGAILFPTQAVMTDLPTCTGGAVGGEYVPIDPNQLKADGRVVLVPFGDFPVSDAQHIASWFKAKYGLDITVGPSLTLPVEAFVVERGQVESDVLLRVLERQYPDTPPRTIAIGLTRADMFIREVNWNYAFSNRLPPRFAVVSPARMDYGCMGILEANRDTRMARLRKMVGKNIGVLFYELPLSGNPRSMMYASIGGPQELDAMREEF